MFHVSTMLPYSKKDSQQIERKRHLGNDAVLIVFHDGATPFQPQCITSKYSQVRLLARVRDTRHTTLIAQMGALDRIRSTWWCRRSSRRAARLCTGWVWRRGRMSQNTAHHCPTLPSSRPGRRPATSSSRRVRHHRHIFSIARSSFVLTCFLDRAIAPVVSGLRASMKGPDFAKRIAHSRGLALNSYAEKYLN